MKIIIEVKGGIVQSVYTDSIKITNADISILDWDVDNPKAFLKNQTKNMFILII